MFGPEPIEAKGLRKKAYKPLTIIPLHVNHPGVKLAVENLSISQQFNPSYKKEEVYGRMDPIVTYSNTTRSMRFNFSCQSHHYFDGVAGVVDNVYQINVLTQLLYPAYKSTGGQKNLLRSPPFFRLQYGSYVGSFGADFAAEGLTGIITGFSHEIGKVARNMAYGALETGEHLALPREIKIGFSFDVIHDKEVGWRRSGDKDQFSLDGYGSDFPYRSGKGSSGAPVVEKTPSSHNQSPEKNDASPPEGSPEVKATNNSSPEQEKDTADSGNASAAKQVKAANADAVLNTGLNLGTGIGGFTLPDKNDPVWKKKALNSADMDKMDGSWGTGLKLKF